VAGISECSRPLIERLSSLIGLYRCEDVRDLHVLCEDTLGWQQHDEYQFRLLLIEREAQGRPGLNVPLG